MLAIVIDLVEMGEMVSEMLLLEVLSVRAGVMDTGYWWTVGGFHMWALRGMIAYEKYVHLSGKDER